MVLPLAGPPTDASLPEGYKAHWNTQYNAWFYENVFTGASVWEKPDQPAPQARPPPQGPPPGYQAAPIENKGNDPASLQAAMASVSLNPAQNPTQQQQQLTYAHTPQQAQTYNPYPSPGVSPRSGPGQQTQAYNPYPSPGVTTSPLQQQTGQQLPQQPVKQAYTPYSSPGVATSPPISQRIYDAPATQAYQATPSPNPATQQPSYGTQQPNNPTQSPNPNAQTYPQQQQPSSGIHGQALGETQAPHSETPPTNPTYGTKGLFSPTQQPNTQPGYVNYQSHQSPPTTGGYPTPSSTPYTQQQTQYGQPPHQQYGQSPVYGQQGQHAQQNQYPQQQTYGQPVYGQQQPQQQTYAPVTQTPAAQRNTPTAAKAGLMGMLGGGMLGGQAAKTTGGESPSHSQAFTPAVYGAPQAVYGQQPAYGGTAQPNYGAPAPAAAPAAKPDKKSNTGGLALLGGGAGLLAGGALVTGLMSGHKKKKKKKGMFGGGGHGGGGHGEEGYYEGEEYSSSDIEEAEEESYDGGGWGSD